MTKPVRKRHTRVFSHQQLKAAILPFLSMKELRELAARERRVHEVYREHQEAGTRRRRV